MNAVSGRLVRNVLRALQVGDFDDHRDEVAERLRQRVQCLHGLGERYAAVRLSAHVESGSTLSLST